MSNPRPASEIGDSRGAPEGAGLLLARCPAGRATSRLLGSGPCFLPRRAHGLFLRRSAGRVTCVTVRHKHRTDLRFKEVQTFSIRFCTFESCASQKNHQKRQSSHGVAVVASAEIDLEAGRKHWAFQALRQPSPPDVGESSWVRTPVDRFVRARQEAAGVSPNAIADARTLIRRAYFDLIGLPPRPEDVDSFVHDAEADPEFYPKRPFLLI